MPTVTIGLNTGNTYTGVQDCYIEKFYPNSVDYYGTDILDISKYDAANEANFLLLFSGLSNIPSNATITGAKLRLYTVESFGALNTHHLRECYRSFVDTQATWNVYSTGNPWQTPGGTGNSDRDNTSIIASLVVNQAVEYKEFSSAALVALVQAWVSGSKTNRGLIVERDDANNYDSSYRNYASSQGVDGNRPELEVTFTTQIFVAPTPIVSSAVIIDPTVVMGSLSMSPAAISANAVTVNPAVTNNVSIRPEAIAALATVLDPTVIAVSIPTGPEVVQTTVVGVSLATIVQRVERQTAVARILNQHTVVRADNETTIH